MVLSLSLYIYMQLLSCSFCCIFYLSVLSSSSRILSSVFISTLLMLTIVVGFVVIVDHASTRLLDFRQVSGGYATEEPAPAVAGA